MILQQLAPEHAEQAWPLMEPYIRQLSHQFPDDWPLDKVRAQMADSTVVPWVIWEEERKECYGVGLTEIVVKPSGRRVLAIHAVGRDHKAWVHLVKRLERHAVLNECTKVEVIGRRGWERSLTDYSKQKLAVLTKELEVNGSAQ